MKEKTAKKIILMLLIIAIACCIKTISYATITVDESTSFSSLETAITTDGGINVSYSTACKNPFIFCRELGGPYPRNDDYLYKKESGPEIHKNDKLSYVFNYFDSYTDNTSMRDIDTQKLYWAYLNQGFLSEQNKKILEKADLYQVYGQELTKYYNEHNTYEPQINIQGDIRLDSDGNYIIGEILIPAYPFDKNLEFGGIKNIKVLNNDDGTEISCKFIDKNGQEITNMVDINKNAKNGFYIKINGEGLKAINIRFEYKYLATETTLYKLYTDSKLTSSGFYYCEEHVDEDIIDYPKNGNGKKYIANGEKNSDYYFRPNIITIGKLYPAAGGEYKLYYDLTYDKKYVCARGHVNSGYNGSADHATCKDCGGIARYVNGFRWKGYKVFNCNNCGYKSTNTSIQKLVIASHNKENGTHSVDSGIIQLITPINITLEKYNYKEEALNGAEFKVTAKQAGVDGELSVIKDNGTFKITPNGDGYIYVLIEETKAPQGYKKIDPINIVYKPVKENDTIISWSATYNPIMINEMDTNDFEGWTYSGFDDITFGEWILVEQNDDNTEARYMSGNGDKIIVDNSEEDGDIIKVYDKAIIETLTLLKIDQDGDSKLLDGAVFKATLKNVESYKFEDKTIFVSEGQTITGIKIIGGKIILEDVVFRDENEDIEIILEETDPPPAVEGRFHYKTIVGEIIITVTHTTGEGLIGKIAYKTENHIEVIRLIINGTPTVDGGAISYNEEGKVVATGKNYELGIVIPNKRLIDISGQVWLDDDTSVNNKLMGKPNGIKDGEEKGIEGIVVHLYDYSNKIVEIKRTDKNGNYKFENIDYDPNGYYVQFVYDGINYERTIDGDSKATEVERETFNNKFYTITQNKAIGTDGKEIALEYNTVLSEGVYKSTLETYENGKIKGEFAMKAQYPNPFDSENKIIESVNNINLGLKVRGTDLALTTGVSDAEVRINGEQTNYHYDDNTRSVDIDLRKQTEDPVYLEIQESDYTYRLRNYINKDFTESDYTENTEKENYGLQSGDTLKVYVKYKICLINQGADQATVDQIKYYYDGRYTFEKDETLKANNLTELDIKGTNPLVINANQNIKSSNASVIYLVFSLDVTQEGDIVDLTQYYTAGEITSYSTEKGLIDIDSQPDNLDYATTNPTYEDDSMKENGLIITIKKDYPRKLSGQVWEETDGYGIKSEDENAINGVVVQLIESKPFNINGRTGYYEYIWQETVSGTGKGRKLSLAADDIETYTYTVQPGYYEFSEFIPGNYFVRFIYGDGTVVDSSLQDEVLKYNGQDYKSIVDKNYNAQEYIADNYTAGESVARDNEARRLETMAYAVDVNAEKGLLLKLLDNVTIDDLNEVEIKTLAGIEPITTIRDARSLLDDEKNALNSKISTLKTEVLNATWMCAETSKVHVEVKNDFVVSDVNLGLEKRPETRISLQKTITSFKLTASNGQTIIDAYWDEDKNEIAGIYDGLQAIPGTSWKYSVNPTELNTIIDGAKLEFAYDVILKNEGEAYLGSALADVYNNNTTDVYITALADNKDIVKADVKANGYNSRIGTYLGKKYYDPKFVVKPAPEAKVEVTKIYDYINNDLDIVEGTELKLKDTTVDHYKLADNHSLQNITIKRVLENKVPSNKLAKDEVVKYKVILGRDPISSTGTLDFTNYIAEVMSFTNAQGRRAVATPGNAWAVDERNLKDDGKERIVEIDECSADKIQLGESYGEDKETIFVWLAIGVTAVAIIGAGAFVTKKYIIK